MERVQLVTAKEEKTRMALFTPLRAIPSMAGPSRLGLRTAVRLCPNRFYSTPNSPPHHPSSSPRPSAKSEKDGSADPDGEQPSLSDFISRERLKAAWQELSLAQRLGFGIVVMLGGYFEYSLMKKYILDPVKEKKEKRARESFNLDGGEIKAFGSDTQ
ncbi:hypothetical protein IAR55_001671 [Kwoniella newhampshirensis]|uniref:Uncharacterized protein n=1 Tax=Kwoniella newhampshirensis TaxID=1651941 RepID=A0AAW0Z2P8_9TREE